MPRVVLLILLSIGASAADLGTDSAGCEIAGKVFDLQDAVVSGSEVLFKNTDSVVRAPVDANGIYRIWLIEGQYEVIVRTGVNFWNFLRSEMPVACNAETRFNFYVFPECVSFGCQRLGAHFDIFEGIGRSDRNPPYKLVIAYLERKSRGKKYEYSNVVLTFGNRTIRANEIQFDKKAMVMVAKEGWQELDDTRTPFRELNLDFLNSILRAEYRISTISDIKNVRRLRKVYLQMRESNILK